MVLTLLLLAIIGSFIGWVTNKIAIKMLFKPVNPIKILFFEIQGVFPKRQNEIAKSLGKVVENELVGLADIKENLMTDENINRLKEKLKEKFNKIIEENIPPVFLAMAGEQINLITEKFISEDNEFFKELFEEFMSSENSVDIKKIVEEKINKMDFSMFEKILLELISKELSFIEYLGAILGFVIGIVQGIIILFIK
jgi:uncharacterized membrane protein YheB (UPF0754 family)